MNRTEFLATLALRLDDLPEDERSEAVQYYSEYLDDAGYGNEESAIAELGGAEKVANIIRANCGYGPRKPSAKAQTGAQSAPGPAAGTAAGGTDVSPTSSGAAVTDSTASAEKAAPLAGDDAPNAGAPDVTVAQAPESVGSSATGQAVAFAASDFTHFAGAQQNGAAGYGAAQSNASAASQPGAAYSAGQAAAPTGAGTRFNNPTNIVLAVLLIFAAIVVLPSLFGILFGVLGALAGIIGGGIHFAISGVGVLFSGIGMLGSSLAGGLATIGVALIALGGGILIGGAGIYVIAKCGPLLWNAMGKFWRFVCRKVRGEQ